MTTLASYLKNQTTIAAPAAPPPQPGAIDKASNFFNNFSAHMASFGEGVLSPLTKGVATVARTVQSTPQLLGEIGSAFQRGDGTYIPQGADQTMAQPVNLGLQSGQQQTLSGSTNTQNIGTAAQAASFLVPAVPGAEALGTIGQGAVSGALQGGGQTAENPNATGKQIAGGAVLGGALGAGLGAAAKYGPEALQKVLPKNSGEEIPKLSPEQQDIQNNITQTQKEVEQAKSQADFAAEQRKTATPQAVQGVKDINTKVAGNIKTLGEQFGNEATQLEKANPKTKLNLTNEQLDALNALKENKNFSLPDKLDNSQNPNSKLSNGYENVKFTGKALEEYKASQKTPQVSLSPTEVQDLIKELNRSTFRQNADGSITKDYQRLGITNEIKSSASQAFGPEWDKIYSKYSQGRGMIDKLDSITNLDSKATPEDLNKQLEGILKQSKTPEGKLLLQQAVDEYKQSSGVDLNNPIKTIQGIADKQTALEEANSNLSDAQKAANKAQRDADIAKLKQEQKMSTFKGRHPILTSNANYFAKRAAWGLTGGAVIGALGLSGLLKKMFK